MSSRRSNPYPGPYEIPLGAPRSLYRSAPSPPREVLQPHSFLGPDHTVSVLSRSGLDEPRSLHPSGVQSISDAARHLGTELGQIRLSGVSTADRASASSAQSRSREVGRMRIEAEEQTRIFRRDIEAFPEDLWDRFGLFVENTMRDFHSTLLQRYVNDPGSINKGTDFWINMNDMRNRLGHHDGAIWQRNFDLPHDIYFDDMRLKFLYNYFPEYRDEVDRVYESFSSNRTTQSEFRPRYMTSSVWSRLKEVVNQYTSTVPHQPNIKLIRNEVSDVSTERGAVRKYNLPWYSTDSSDQHLMAFLNNHFDEYKSYFNYKRDKILKSQNAPRQALVVTQALSNQIKQLWEIMNGYRTKLKEIDTEIIDRNNQRAVRNHRRLKNEITERYHNRLNDFMKKYWNFETDDLKYYLVLAPGVDESATHDIYALFKYLMGKQNKPLFSTEFLL